LTISFLLPTARDRLRYLKIAVETVRRQSSPDWEICISDNFSDDEIEPYVRSLADSRIRYSRTASALPVTDNWNAALALSTGEYVLMLGDDDGVLPGYVAEMAALVDRFDAPDLIYTGSLVFTYPGVDPARPDGFLASNSHAEFFDGAAKPFLLGRERALDAVRKSMEFRLAFNFNMQLSLVSRRLIDELRPHGDFFQSPFPDYYASCVAMLTARSVVVDPRELVVIGVTPKSYGFFHLNDRETEGRAFLHGTGETPAQAPGTNINEGWLGAMEAIEAGYGAEYGLRVNRRRYRLVQAGTVYSRQRQGIGSRAEIVELEASLPAVERMLLRIANRTGRVIRRLLPASAWEVIARRVFKQFPPWDPPRDDGGYQTLLEVFERAESRGLVQLPVASQAEAPRKRRSSA
jgi:glycosyltransferase involved in cell wall biosynthesis